MPTNPSTIPSAEREARMHGQPTKGGSVESVDELTSRDNHDARNALEKEVRENAVVRGLTIPGWTPRRENIPEDSFIPG